MPIIHNESFSESDPFCLRKYGFYDMEGGPPVIEEPSWPGPVTMPMPPRIVELSAAVNAAASFVPPLSDLDYFKAYWTPERRARRVAEELGG